VAVTIKQIAELAGLSVPTVSRILNNDGEPFRQETRNAVLKAAQEMGYRPNSYRMALRTKKFNVIGLLFCADRDQSALSRLTHFALLGELHKQNKHLLAGQFCGDTHQSTDLFPKMLREWSVDGVLIDTPAATSSEAERWMKRTHIPAIYLNGRRDADCVYADETAGAREATARLLNLGHKRIMYLSLGRRGERGESDSKAGYDAAMKAAGHAPRWLTDSVPVDERLAYLSEWINAQPAKSFPTAVLCGDAGCAMPLYLAARVAGRSVPGDLSILAIHDGLADALGVRLAVMCLPTAELATAGLEALDRKIASPSQDVPPVALPLTYEPGATVGEAP
jgi:LacI family transcriptional regulator